MLHSACDARLCERNRQLWYAAIRRASGALECDQTENADPGSPALWRHTRAYLRSALDGLRAVFWEAARTRSSASIMLPFTSPSLSLNQAALSPRPPRLVHETLIHRTIVNIFCLGSEREVWTYRITIQTTRIMLW